MDLVAGGAALVSVGVFLYTGEFVFTATNAAKMLMQHLEASPVPPSHRADAEVPPELDAVILACLAKRPDERPSSAQELSARLAACPVRRPWTEARAAEWWDRHLPVAGDRPRGGSMDVHVDFVAAPALTERRAGA